jgi:branched-chain amino acid transport system permease protein
MSDGVSLQRGGRIQLAGHRRGLSVLLPVVFALLIIVARFLFPNKMTFLVEVSIWSIYIMGNNILMGYLGYVSFGQPFYLSCGAYTAALYLAYLGHNPLIAIALSIVTGLVLGFIFGLTFLRLRSSYFTLINAALCAMGVFLFEKLLIDVTNGNDGLWYRTRMVATPLLDIRLPKNYFFFVIAVLLAVLLLYRQMDRSALGAVFRATRANERKVQFLGINTFRVKLLGFTLATVMSSFAGALFAVNFGFVNPNLGENSRAIEVIVATLLGGVGSLYGPLFGALGFLGIKDIVSNFVSRWELIVGIVTMLVLFRFNEGIWGFILNVGEAIRSRLGPRRPGSAAGQKLVQR